MDSTKHPRHLILWLFALLLTGFSALACASISSHKGLQGELDTRLLTEHGRDQIAEDLLKSGMIVNSLKLIATEKNVSLTDFFKETAQSNTVYETVKASIRKNPQLAHALQDPNLAPAQKEQMLDQITRAVIHHLNAQAGPYNHHLIDTTAPGKDGQQVAGFYSKQTGDVYINDLYQGNTPG